MADMKASVVLGLVDRITKPIRRISRQFSALARQRSFQQLREAVTGVGRSFQATLESAGKLIRRLALIGGSAAAATYGLERFISGVTNTADSAVKTADRLGLPVQKLQEWQYAAQLSGLETNTFNMALQRFTRRAAEAANGTGEAEGALKFLGLQLRDSDGRMRSTTELLPEVADKIAALEDPAMRVRVAFKLFDSEGVAMINMLKGGSSALAAMEAQARSSGAVMTEEMARGAEDYTDQMTHFRQSVFGLRVAIVQNLLPAVTEWISKINEMVRGNRELISGRVVEWLKGFWEGLKSVGSVIKWVADLVGGWRNLLAGLSALVAGKLLLSIGMLIVSLLNVGRILTVSVIKLVPIVITAVASLAKGFVALAARAIPMAIGGIRALSVALLTTPVGWIITAVSAIAGAAYLIYENWGQVSAFFSDLWKGVKAWFSQGLEGIARDLLAWSPGALILKGIDKVFEAFGARPLSEIGSEWIGGLWQGMETQLSALTAWLDGKLSALTQWLPDWAKNGLGIESSGRAPALGSPALSENQSLPMSAGGRTEVGGVMRIEIDSSGRPAVRELTKNGPMDLDVDLGLSGLMP
jgi:hypothetical protein